MFLFIKIYAKSYKYVGIDLLKDRWKSRQKIHVLRRIQLIIERNPGENPGTTLYS